MSKNLAIAYAQFEKSFLFKSLVPFMDIFKNVDDPNFWDKPENKPFIDYIDGHVTRLQSGSFREITRKEIIESIIRSLISLDQWIARWCKIKVIEEYYIEPLKLLLSHL